MPLQFFGVDNEFAAATGSNVNSSPGQSTFDNPPQGSKDLVITTLSDDNDPRLFELGDTYEVSWGGQVGGGTILNAVVIRSDPAPDSGGIIVFEGLDENGELTHIIWTPDFDLEGWYADNYNPSAEPGFYTSDTQAEYDHRFVCFAAATLIRTPQGLRAAGDLQQGEMVCTVDAGDVPIEWVTRWHNRGIHHAAPVCFDTESIGNFRPLRLSQQHRVLIKSPRLQVLFGMDEALAPAKAFVNGDTIRVQQCAQICYVHILLRDHHLIEAEGACCETLFWGDETAKRLLENSEFDVSLGNQPPRLDLMKAARPLLKYAEARLVLQEPQTLHFAPAQLRPSAGRTA